MQKNICQYTLNCVARILVMILNKKLLDKMKRYCSTLIGLSTLRMRTMKFELKLLDS